MQFIDQAAAYNAKAISLEAAIRAGRAKLTNLPGSSRLLACFRLDLDAARGFDRTIDPRVKFNDLPTDEKLDLMIDTLLPGFYQATLLPFTGQDSWLARFVIDGHVIRLVRMDATGVHCVQETGEDPAFELETDIMTLMAILRFVIAASHTKKLDLAGFGLAPSDQNADETIAI